MKHLQLLLLSILSFSLSSFCFANATIDEEINVPIHKWHDLYKEKKLSTIKKRVDEGSLPINWIDGNSAKCSYLPSALFIAAREQPNLFILRNANKKAIIKSQKNWGIVKYLLSKNASLCEKDTTRSGNLSRYAVSQPTILEEILKQGDDPNRFIIDNGDQFYTYDELNNPMSYQQTAISSALRVQPAKKRYKVIEILLKHGASATNLDATTNDYSYIPIVSEGFFQQKTNLKWRLKTINLLIDYGAKIKVLTYTKDGQKECNLQAAIFGKLAKEKKEPKLLALWNKYNTNDPFKYCKPDDFKK